MSQFAAAPSPSETRPASNSLGFAGFLCSTIGLVCTIGILCPIGFILSLFGLRKQPRGFAIAGTIIGFIGSAGLLIMSIAGVLAFAAIASIAQHGLPFVHTVVDGASLYHQVELYRQSKGTLPTTIADLQVDSAATIDGWGHAFRYQLNPDGSFTIYSDGPDGKQGTVDDIPALSSSPEFSSPKRTSQPNGPV